jgi:hypothetical protein
MKPRTILVALVFCLSAVAGAFAQESFMGSWKLNDAKSKSSAGAPKNNTVIYEAAGDQTKVTVDGVDGSGNPLHHEWTGKFDGKDYPVTGDSTADTRAYKRVNDHTLTFVGKKNGKVVQNGRVTVSPDGKSRTVHVTGTDANGKKTTQDAVYDKQ